MYDITIEVPLPPKGKGVDFYVPYWLLAVGHLGLVYNFLARRLVSVKGTILVMETLWAISYQHWKNLGDRRTCPVQGIWVGHYNTYSVPKLLSNVLGNFHSVGS